MFEKLLSLFKKDIQVEPKVEPEISFEQFNKKALVCYKKF